MSAVIVVTPAFNPFEDIEWGVNDLDAVRSTPEERAFMTAMADISEPEEPSVFVGE